MTQPLERRPEASPGIEVGVVATPGVAADAAQQITSELCRELGDRYPGYEWHATSVVDRTATSAAGLVEIMEATRARLLEEDWDLALAVTDHPLRVGRRPVADYASPTHRVGVVSLPALGAVGVRRRLQEALLEQVGEILVEDAARPRQGRAARIAPPEEDAGGILFPFAVVFANLRLLVGMVAANRPWRFAMRLYRVLVTAIATAVFALITAEVWELADAAGWPRLLTASVVAVAAIVGVIIAAHGLWERAPNPRVRQDVVLFNLATTITVALGVLVLYVALFGICLAASYLIIDEDVIEGVVGHEAGVTSYLILAWLLTSIATLGGALGAGLESGSAIREAAYTPDEDAS